MAFLWNSYWVAVLGFYNTFPFFTMPLQGSVTTFEFFCPILNVWRGCMRKLTFSNFFQLTCSFEFLGGFFRVPVLLFVTREYINCLHCSYCRLHVKVDWSHIDALIESNGDKWCVGTYLVEYGQHKYHQVGLLSIKQCFQ